MEIQFYGANCVRLTAKKANIVIDDNLADLGQKSVTKAGEIALFTGAHDESSEAVKIAIDQPGEYEVSEISVQGIAARAHTDEEGAMTATIFKVEADEVRVVAVGHIHPDLADKQLEEIGMVDVLIVPVGGGGYTLDSVGALKVIHKIDPKIVIPVHYEEKGFAFPVPQRSLSDALHELGMEPAETVAKLKVKLAELTDTTRLIVLERQQ